MGLIHKHTHTYTLVCVVATVENLSWWQDKDLSETGVDGRLWEEAEEQRPPQDDGAPEERLCSFQYFGVPIAHK